MNPPVHIITCQTPSMNLPAHGTASPDPSITLKLKLKTHKSYSVGFSPGALPRVTRLNWPRPPGGSFPPPGANAATDPLFPGHRLADLPLPPGASLWSASRQAPYRRHSAADFWHSILVNSTALVTLRATHLLVSVPHSDLLPIPNLF